MRTVINSRHLPPRRRSVALVLALLVTALAPGSGARADTDVSYFSTRSILRAFFPSSEKVTYRTVALTPELKQRIGRRLGYAPPAERYTIFVATTRDGVDGYALIDDQLGEHQPITFATKLSARAVVERVEIVTYREPRGDEVRDPRFREQFVGKSARDPLRLNHGIDAVTGATVSSAAAVIAVRRAAVLVDEVMVGATITSAADAPNGPHRTATP